MHFTDFHLQVPILKAIEEQGYSAPTQIQEKAIPLVNNGQDIIGHSETGSGKTAAFGLPILNELSHGNGITALVLTPTRELCLQVCEALNGFGKYMHLRIVPVFGGVGIAPQLKALRTADVVVATPGRLLDVMGQGVRLNAVRYLVLDEADRMLDMGFINDVEKIIRFTPRQRQTLLFSATVSQRLRSLVNNYMRSPVPVQGKTRVDTHLLAECAYTVQAQDKLSLLAHLLNNETTGIALVFCKTRRNCDRVSKSLRAQRIDATPIHGGLSQGRRTETIANLHKRGMGILIATDVASRGLHIDNISHVYNYDLPQTADDYVHRIGRTARAGAKGNAVTFVTPQDNHDFQILLRGLKRKIAPATLPAFEKIAMVTGPSHGRSRQQQNNRPFWKRKHRHR
jgi:superfamily II DNA/RNA helicase